MKHTKIGIVGYGNLGKGVKKAVKHNKDIELIGIFTRRPPNTLNIEDNNINVYNVDQAGNFTDEIDVMVLCGGSATDLPVQGPKYAEMFNTVDSFDTHADIPEYYQEINQIALDNDNTCAISIGWDPGLFSLNRLIGESVLPQGNGYTFWGPGVSQGHSDAIRRIDGVKNAVQYTIPINESVESVRNGENPDLQTDEKHLRKCYVVVEQGADKDDIKEKIKTMPNYFEDYNTEVNFISEKELQNEHSEMPHGGFVMRSAKTGENNDNDQIIEFSLKLDSNPEFTASVLIAYSRAVHRLNNKEITGAKTVFDIPPGYLSMKSLSELREKML